MRSAVKEAGDRGGERERGEERDAESSCVVGEWRAGGGDSVWPPQVGTQGTGPCSEGRAGRSGAAGTQQNLLAGRVPRNRGGC